jgi:uncharacterized membrane protein YgcG
MTTTNSALPADPTRTLLGLPLEQALDAHHEAAANVAEALLGRVVSTTGAMLTGPYARLEAKIAELEQQSVFMQQRIAVLEQARGARDA